MVVRRPCNVSLSSVGRKSKWSSLTHEATYKEKNKKEDFSLGPSSRGKSCILFSRRRRRRRPGPPWFFAFSIFSATFLFLYVFFISPSVLTFFPVLEGLAPSGVRSGLDVGMVAEHRQSLPAFQSSNVSLRSEDYGQLFETSLSYRWWCCTFTVELGLLLLLPTQWLPLTEIVVPISSSKLHLFEPGVVPSSSSVTSFTVTDVKPQSPLRDSAACYLRLLRALSRESDKSQAHNLAVHHLSDLHGLCYCCLSPAHFHDDLIISRQLPPRPNDSPPLTIAFHNGDSGRRSWPELVGEDKDYAVVSVIKKECPGVKIFERLKATFSSDFEKYWVWVHIDDNNKVHYIPNVFN